MNIVIIGLMGAGKTSVGKKLSKLLNYDFVDMDEYIIKKAGMDISEIFDKFGEEYFREKETEAAIEIGNMSKTIISTGGGVVLNNKNMLALKKNAKVLYIYREVSDILKNISIDKRPLLKENPNKLYEIYNERAKLYNNYADIAITGVGYSNRTAKKAYDMLLKGGHIIENNGD